MALILEDGTGKSDAESFASAADYVAYAAKFGLTVPSTEAEQEANLRNAALQMQAMSWKGCRAHFDQALSWPRKNAEVYGEILPSTLIPARIQYGQMALAAEIYKDEIDPPEKRRGAKIRTRVEGAIDVEYAQLAGVNQGKLMPAAPDRPSHAQFADYLAKRGLFAVRA
ncbi:hypothetical protein I5I61_18905 [Pseudomonas nitroreducens]|uniref:Putative DnaT-like domain-containing protein n=1 Tax=Pseudomonas nitroreducens TaxID=46680 RepID=A0ABS0KN68_PSENT|nr:DnaT-like ssDNA-binding protein [Pseudomonas nitroreducens]MBG6289527.1 hypothetical protein [Pseudomonas nitroreducens]